MKCFVWMKVFYFRCMTGLMLLMVSTLSFADGSGTKGLIPTSAIEDTAQGSSVATTAMNIFQQEILPFLEVGLSMLLLYKAITGLWKGYDDYQREKNFEPLKSALVASVILVTFGGGLIFLLDMLRTAFNG